jgi:DNA (cytosine-5)-methyltransferase 1
MFNLWQNELERLGYANFAQVLNSKDYGVPQNRERIFLVSIRIDDVRDRPKYNFPKPFPLEKRLKDVLEDSVDEKYYLSDERVEGLLNSTRKESERGNGFAFSPTDGDCDAHAIKTQEGSRKTDNFLFDFDEKD